MRPTSLLTFLLVPVFLACSPAHREQDGGIGPDSGRPAVCGDLFVNADVDEECDDGNKDSGDGCDEDCKVEIPVDCGDNVFDADIGEECDDGGNEAGDGCGPGCWIEGCGNNYLDPGEACEDNNTVDGDGCSADCKSNETCGNGIKDPGEGCDDGDGDDTDECPASCEAAVCGDGFVQSGVESCDDGNAVADDGCTECILDSCGDNSLDDGEECDLGAGNGLNGTTCFRNCISTDIEAGKIDTIQLDPHGDIGSAPQNLEAGDFNGDGRPDLLITDTSSGYISVAYGLGDGRVWPTINHLRDGGSIRAVELVDVNGDALLDVVAVTSLDTVMVMLGNGVGFDAPTSDTTIIDIGGDNPLELVVAELTGDAFLDVATASNTSNDVVIMAGDGTGRFSATTRLATPVGEAGQRPSSIALGDVDDDGNVDIVTANSTSDDVSLFRGLGNGQYAGAEVFTTRVGAGGDNPSDIVITDVTNDGVPDVVVVCSTSDDVVILAAAGGNLAAPQRFSTLLGEGGDNPTRLAVVDVTQDGIKDLITSNSGSHDISILPGLGAGVAFGAPTLLSNLTPEGAGTTPREVQVGDFNGDSIVDIAVANASTADVSIFIGTGNGAFEDMRAFSVRNNYLDGGAASILKIGDINGDGTQDIVTSTSSSVAAMAGLGDGLFTPAFVDSTATAGGAAVGDLDGDGLLDFVSIASTTMQSQIQIYNGSFARNGSFSTSGTGQHVALGEFTGDSLLDAAFFTSNQVVYSAGTETGQFASQLTASTLPSAVGQSILADVTGDGELDSVMAGLSQSAVLIGSGTGTGSFSAPALVTSSAGSSGLTAASVAAADLNGDSKFDIVTANRSTNDLTVLLGEGSGAFADPLIVPTVFGADPASVEDVAIGDFNGDNIPDLCAVNPARDSISVMLGFGNGVFAAPQTYPVLGRPISLTVADFDGDGIDDIAVAGIDAGTITTFTSFAHP
jgi:cysteine-rich repeat protein